MRQSRVSAMVGVVIGVVAGSAWGYTFNNLGNAGGWDDVSKSTFVTVLVDQSDFTSDVSSEDVAGALTSAFGTWDAVDTANKLSFRFQNDLGGNYDVFDGPYDSSGPPWFNGTSATLDQNAHWTYANIVVGGWLPGTYFGQFGERILAVTWTGKISGDGSRKPVWHSEVFFNEAYTWSTDEDPAAGAFDIETVALHELGHTIGLGHEDDVPSIMGTYYLGVQRELRQDDIDGVTALYSSQPGGGKGGGNGGGPKKLVIDGVEWYLTGVTYAGDSFGVGAIVPEPGTMLLLAAGGAAAILRKRRREQ